MKNENWQPKIKKIKTASNMGFLTELSEKEMNNVIGGMNLSLTNSEFSAVDAERPDKSMPYEFLILITDKK